MIKGSAKVERAVELLDQGMEPRQAAKECGYKDAGTMMAAISRYENRMAVTVLTEPKKPEAAPAKRKKREAEKPAKAATLAGDQIAKDYAQAVSKMKSGESLRADAEVKTEHLVLTYNEETKSIRINVKGNRHYLWVDGRSAKPRGIAGMLMELRAACASMVMLIEEEH